MRMSRSDPTSSFLDSVFREVEYTGWYCGHLHMDKYLEEHMVHVLYQQYMRLI